MANRLKTWGTEILTSTDLNAEFDNIYTGTTTKTSGSFGLNNDIPLIFGTTSQSKMEWDTGQSSPALMLGLSGSRTLIVCETADMGTDFQLATRANPSILVHSSDATTLADYIEMYHDQTDGVINVGAGGFKFLKAGTALLRLAGDANKSILLDIPPTVTLSTGTTAAGVYVRPTITASAGHTVLQAAFRISPGGMITQGASETINVLSSIYVAEPNITLSTGDTITTAATVFIASTPTEGVNNYALYANGAARFDGTLNVGNSTSTMDGKAHIKAGSTSEIGLVVEAPDSSTVDTQQWHYNGTAGVSLAVKAAETKLSLASRDLGNDTAGPYIEIGRNSNVTNSNAGTIKWVDVGNTPYYTWMDDNGTLRIHTSPPGGAVSDTAGSFMPKSSSNFTTDTLLEAAGANTVGSTGVYTTFSVGLFMQNTYSGNVLRFNNGTNNTLQIGSAYYNGLATQDYGCISLASLDTGPDTPGPSIVIGRNSNATTPVSGSLRFINKNGIAYFLWVDASGKLRIANLPPGDGAPDTYGVVVGTQT